MRTRSPRPGALVRRPDTYYTGGWVYVASPPTVIVRIDRPYVYRRYRPSGYVVRQRPVPVARVKRPPPRVYVRDHRR